MSSTARRVTELLDLQRRLLHNCPPGQDPPLADQLVLCEKKRDLFEFLANHTVPGVHRDEAMQVAADAAEQVRTLRQHLRSGGHE